MMKHDLDYMIAVMKAAKDGKTIEFRPGGFPDWCVTNGIDISWNWEYVDYRIKPENEKTNQEYVPYESAEEFLQGQKEHGPYVSFIHYVNGITFFIPSLVVPNGVHIHSGCNSNIREGFIDFSDLVTWQDGTPCGKLK